LLVPNNCRAIISSCLCCNNTYRLRY